MTLGGSNSDSNFRHRRPVVCECGDHAFSGIGRGFVTLTSPEDAHLLARPWHACVSNGGKYVIARGGLPRTGGSRGKVLLARQIMQPPDGLFVDHINHDTLDNRRRNLRLASRAQNQMNRRTVARALPKGVRLHRGRFDAQIKLHGVRHWLGSFDTPEEAHAAYASAAARLHGEFACLE